MEEYNQTTFASYDPQEYTQGGLLPKIPMQENKLVDYLMFYDKPR